MTPFSFRLPALLAFATAAAVAVQAQTQLDTITGHSQVGSLQDLGVAIDSNSYIGFAFSTGSNPGGYSLTSINARLSTLTAGTDLFGSLYLGTPSTGLPDLAQPRGGFITFSTPASSPSFSDATFIPTAPITLLANTEYVFALTPGTTSTGSWSWAATATAPTGWSMTTGTTLDGSGAIRYVPSDGFSATNPGIIAGSNGFYLMASIEASPVPEPSTYAAMAGVGVLGVTMYLRRRRRTEVSVA